MAAAWGIVRLSNGAGGYLCSTVDCTENCQALCWAAVQQLVLFPGAAGAGL